MRHDPLRDLLGLGYLQQQQQQQSQPPPMMSSKPDEPAEPTPAEETLVAAPCPCCGAYSSTTLAVSSPLLAVCDVLVIRALEVVGKRIVRAERSRFSRLNNKPWHIAHTIWRPDEAIVVKALNGAWDVVPALLDVHGCCNTTARQVTTMLDQYVRDLLITGTAHDIEELRYRFSARLGIDVPTPLSYSSPASPASP